VAKRRRDNVFSMGNTIDPADGYRAFRGRDAGVAALMRKRGFPAPAATAPAAAKGQAALFGLPDSRP
jgi:peptidyl-dipeptidase Dcp